MSLKSISCVIPTLNSGKTLEWTILSLQGQKNVEVEILVVDSGSTDETLSICRRLNIPTIQVPPGNIYLAINSGLHLSTTEWIFYLNSDDLLYSDSLERLLNAGHMNEADIVYGNSDYIDFLGRFIYSFQAATPDQILPLFRLGMMGFAQQSAIFKRKLYKELNGFDQSFKLRGDADFFRRAVLSGAVMYYLSGPPVSCFRIHPGQLSNQNLPISDIEAERIFKTPEMSTRITDYFIGIEWKARNIPNYLIRILREYVISGKLKLPKSIDHYSH